MVQQELEEIENQFQKNRDQVISMLLETVMNVHLEVPRVVKQNIKSSVEEWDD